MGDPKSIRRKYAKPLVPWQKERLTTEKTLMQKYGLRRKQEIYRAESKLKAYKETAKRLVTRADEQAEKERQQLFNKLKSYGLLQEESVTAVLDIQLEQLLDRRLQTVLVDQGLARSVKQARQLIVHRHVVVGDKKVTSPGHLITIPEEHTVRFHDNSPFRDEDHPERPQPDPVQEELEESGIGTHDEPTAETEETGETAEGQEE